MRLSFSNVNQEQIEERERIRQLGTLLHALMLEDRADTVPGGGFAITGTNPAKWNDAENAARDLLGYTQNELPLIRQAFLARLCGISGDYAFLKPENLALRLTLEEF